MLLFKSLRTLDWSAGSLFQVQRGLSGKPGPEVNGAETCNAHRVSSFAGRLFQKKSDAQIASSTEPEKSAEVQSQNICALLFPTPEYNPL